MSLTDWKVGSGWLNVFESSIASSLLNLSNQFWSIASSLLSVEGFEDLAGEEYLLLLLSLSLATALSGVL